MKILGFLFLALLMFPSCVNNKLETLERKEIATLNAESIRDSKTYIIGPGDRLAIRSFFNNALNEQVTVRPDGKISLQLVNEIQAAGLTPSELNTNLTEAYARVLMTSVPSSDKYVIAVGDTIAIKSYYHEKLNDTVVVRPDGRISLLLVDEVQASGYTPAELDALLTEKYRSFLESPDLSVIVLSFHRPDLTVIVQESSAQKIFVGGEVKKPTLVKISGKLSILDAIIQAEGPLGSGDLSRVVLIRRASANEPIIFNINIKDVLQGMTQDIWLRPYDIVYVPKTNISDISTFVRTHLWDLLPSQVLFNFIYDFNPEVLVENK